ncbi:FUSC family protein [Mycolicibacterium chubuense]|uniref:FUSC family protein n=1 Tax=Mycolicibacterium chubuense TaxID=1800 RepID=UPI000317243D|nr:FUSC family protein [Mycolicibacterium chubuense]
MPPAILRDIVAVNRLTGRWPFALRAGVCMAVPVATGWLLGDVAAGLTATIGGFTALYGSGRPYLYRARELALIALALAAAVTLGDWAATIPWVGVLTTSAIAAVAVLICNALMVGPPGAYMFALACAAGVGISVEHESPWRLGLLVLCGGAFSWLVHMSGALVRFRGPERAAVAAAQRAVSRLARDVGTAGENRAIDAAARALHESWVVLVNFQPTRPGRSAGLQRLRATNHRLHAMFADLVSGGSAGGGATPADEVPSQDEMPLGRPSSARLVSSALSASHPRRVAGQTAVAALCAGAIATTLGIERGYWAIAAAVLVLHNGFDRRRTVVRGLQRLVGTWAGLALAGVILAVHPQGLWLAPLLLVMQFLIEMLVVRN